MEKLNNLSRSESFTSTLGFGHNKSYDSSGLAMESHTFTGESENEMANEGRFEWKSQWQHAMFFFSYTISWGWFIRFNAGDVLYKTKHRINLFQIILGYVFLGCPVLFIQTFLGQFTQKGCLVLGEMMPFAYGVGFLMLLNTFASAVFDLYHSSILLFYVFVAITNYPIPAWMLCLPKYYNFSTNCMGLTEIDMCESCYMKGSLVAGACFSPKAHNLSGTLFLRHIVFNFDRRSPHFFGYPDAKLFVHLIITAILVFFAIIRMMRDLEGALRIWNMATVASLTAMIAVLLFVTGRFQGFYEMVNDSWFSFLEIGCWVETVRVIILYLKLSEGGHILFGSYTPVTVNTGIRVTYLSACHFSLLITFNIFMFLLGEIFLCDINTKLSAFRSFSSTEALFVFYPVALGIFAAAPLWGSIYFLMAFGLTVQSVVIQIIVLEASISGVFIKASYFIYTRFFILATIFGLTVFLLTPRGSNISSILYAYFGINRYMALFLFISTMMLYGVRRLSDDVYFLLRSQPSPFYSMSWFISLILSTASLLMFLLNAEIKRHLTLLYLIILLIIATVALSFVYKFVVYLKNKDLTSLLRPADSWGPSDPEARTERRLFNPRYEVRFRRRVEQCNHRCLLNSIFLKKNIEKELRLVSNVLLEIQDNEDDRKLKMDVIEALQKHRVVLSEFLEIKEISRFKAKKRLKAKILEGS